MSEPESRDAFSAEDQTDPLDEMRASVEAFLKHQQDRLQQLEVRSEHQRRAAVDAVIAETHAALDRNPEPGAWTQTRSALHEVRERARGRREDHRDAKRDRRDSRRSHSERKQGLLQRLGFPSRRATAITDSPLLPPVYRANDSRRPGGGPRHDSTTEAADDSEAE